MNPVVGHVNELQGAVDGKDLLHVILVHVPRQVADVHLCRLRRRASLPLLRLQFFTVHSDDYHSESLHKNIVTKE